MPQYHISFAEKLSQVARLVLLDGIVEIDAQRTVLYLSLLSTEIALKAMLEQAGKPIDEIRSRSHNITALLSDLDRCSVLAEIVPGEVRACPASRIRSHLLIYGAATVTVGAVIATTTDAASKYPNEVRYGDQITHYPADVMVQLAEKVVYFARCNWDCLRLCQS